jgi:hypothetical protein
MQMVENEGVLDKQVTNWKVLSSLNRKGNENKKEQ